MAITSPALSMSIEALFAAVKPATDTLQKLGAIDFTDEAPGIDIKPGATINVPIASVTAASEYNTSSNHYGTGGATSFASLTAKHYLQGFDISGVDIDKGLNLARMRNIFAKRAGLGVSLAAMGAVKTALDACTACTSTTDGIKMPAASDITVADYLGLGSSITWLDKSTAALAVNGATLADIKSKLAATHVVAASDAELAGFLGVGSVVLIPGMTARACIVPAGAFGSLARVPKVIVDYEESGVETDEESGLSIGIVVNGDRNLNRRIVNADLWFGVATATSNAAAAQSGIVKYS